MIYDLGRCGVQAGWIASQSQKTKDCPLDLWLQKVRRGQGIVCESYLADCAFEPEDAVQADAQRDLAWFHGLILDKS